MNIYVSVLVVVCVGVGICIIFEWECSVFFSSILHCNVMLFKKKALQMHHL